MLSVSTCIPRSLRDLCTSSPLKDRLAADLLRTLPAPWGVEPKVSSMDLGAPASTKELVPMVPGMKTGCPVLLYLSGISAEPGGKARVAPFLWTQTRLFMPSTVWVSCLAMLWATSYTMSRPRSSDGWRQTSWKPCRTQWGTDCLLPQAKFTAHAMAPL